ncbi:MAG: hypothetical protein M0010_15245 [Actinomycetota bacterium]|jgi:hypothetical protein|nr:hypothetical protein [Actinomycetota bacterium]
MKHRRSADEAYLEGRDEGFDRGYEEGFAAARAETKDRRLPRVASTGSVANRAPCERRAGDEHSALVLGFLGLLAYGAWRLLRTWPGRAVVVGSVIAFSGVVSLAVVVLAVVIGAFVLAWATRTAERAVADTRRGAKDLAAAVSSLRRR